MSEDTLSESISRRRFLRTTGGVAAATAIAGCSGGRSSGGGGNGSGQGGSNGSSGSNASTGDGGEGGGSPGTTNARLDLTNATMTSLDPAEASDTASGAVTTQLFDGLMDYPNGGVPVETSIAADYELSEDFRTYTFELKEGVKFHDGRPVTAADFVYAYERLAAAPKSAFVEDVLTAVGIVHEETQEGEYVPGSMRTEAVDERTFQFTIEQPFASALQVLSNNQFGAIPEGIVGDIEGYDGEMPQGEFATKKPIGAGPFEFDNWEQGTQASVSRFENYHGETPTIDGVHWQVIEDDSALYNYAMNGNADTFELPTAQYDPKKLSVERTDDQDRRFGTYGPLRNGETANYVGVPTLSIFYIGFNMETVEKPVRQAVAHALDQTLVVEQVFKGRGVPAYHYTIPSIYPGGPKAYEKHAKEAYPYGYGESQLDAARRVMSEAGYGEGNRYKLDFTIYESGTWEQTAGILRDQLASAYVDMSIQTAPFSTLLERIENSKVDAFSLAWIVPWAAPDAFVKHLNPATSDPSAGTSVESYNSWPTNTPAAKKAIRAWERVQENPEPTNEAERIRDKAYVTMEEANWADVANLPVYHEITERFSYRGVDIPPFGIAGDYKQKFNTVTIDN